jgi:hypothetical protein
VLRIKFIVRQVRISSWLTVLCLLLAAASLAHAQQGGGFNYPPLPTERGPKHKVVDNYTQIPTPPPSFTIPVGPLGFSVPGENYLLRHQSLVSLDFLDEDRILFTFRVSGLMERDADDKAGKEQQIRALVLTLPSGKIESQAAWIVPDRLRYLWMLHDGHFLLRVPDGLDEGDAQLKTTSYMHFPGQLQWIQMDPTQQLMIANSLESATAAQKPGEHGPPAADPPTAAADGKNSGDQSILVARTLKRATGDVIHISRVPWTSQTSDFPMNSEGYLQSSRKGTSQWQLTHWDLRSTLYAGGERYLATVESGCPPEYTYVSDSELLVTTCDPEGGAKMSVISANGNTLWETKAPANAIWPLLATTPSGSRVVRETVLLKRSVDRYKHLLGAKDIQGQIVRVFDTADGKMMLQSPLTPILDGGGNIAISPSGQRVAILNAGAIQIFQLPAPSPLHPAAH